MITINSKKIFNKFLKYFFALNKSYKIILLLIVLAIISLIVFIVTLWYERAQQNIGIEQTEIIDEPIVTLPDETIPSYYIRRSIDGIYTEPAEANLYPIAVMIDNDPNARPQAGLAQAQLVYEAKAEGGITRFMAIFAGSDDLPIIGPIRSARPYYIDWARGFGALYVHVGGSPEALAILEKIDMFDINEFYQGKYFWRSDAKIAPHNVYGSQDNFQTYLKKLNATNRGYNAWLYKDEAPENERGKKNITIDYSVNDFFVEWKYDQQSNNYIRYMAGQEHKDTDGTQISAKNIVIMQVAAKVIDDKLRREMSDIGEGKAWYCFDGYCAVGNWKKSDSDTREKIYNSSGEEVRFNAGTTWIQVVQYEEELGINE